MRSPCLIIAEAGVNHNGDPALAKQLIDAAADAGADAVKFQTFRADELAAPDAPKAAYQRERSDAGESQLEMLRRLELSRAEFAGLAAHAAARGIAFLSTAFDPESLAMLVSLDVSRIKIPSGEITNPFLLRAAARYRLPILLSTGMSTLEEVGEALALLEREQAGPVTLLHCTTAYPAPFAEVNLNALKTLRRAFPGVAVGYSDHTPGIAVAVAAAALGATVLEKHLTLDRRLPGVDQAASLEPAELAELVRSVRQVEAALGDGRKEPAAGERANRAVARRSIVASRAIAAGECFSEANLAFRRPGTGISPMRIDTLLGRRAGRNYRENEVIDE